MKNNFYKALAAKMIFTLMLGNATMVFAESSSVQKALEGVRDQLDTLVTAKDENSNNDIGLRIETFKKVIDLAEQETKDLKLKLLDYSDSIKDPAFIDWRGSVVDGLNGALKHYGEERDLIANNKISDLDGIKALARQFKDWRDEKYAPIADEVNDFILVIQGQKSVQTAKKRLQKIAQDVNQIQKSKTKGSAALTALLKKSSDSINEGAKKTDSAKDLFWVTYITPASSTSTDNSSSSIQKDKDAKPSQASSTDNSASTTAAVIEQPSIKDLVKDALGKLKEAYQSFIEMSNLVRKLLS